MQREAATIMHVAPMDIGIVAAYFALLLVIAFWRRRSGDEANSAEDYLLAGRRLTGPAFVATLVSTWYGSILGVGEYTYLYGISNWLVFGVPYYLAAILFAVFLAGRARRSRVLSIPDQLERSYGRKVALVGTVVVFLISLPAAYVLMLGELLQWFFGGRLLPWMISGTAFSVLYVWHGGFRNVIRTDVPQFVLMFAGFALLLAAAVLHHGSWPDLRSSLPDTHLQPTGGLGIATVLVWYFIALQTLIEPTFYQRCYAARSEGVARWGLLASVGFWLVFDALTTFSGLYARAILGGDSEAMLSYPDLASLLLPAGLLGVFFVSLISVVLSTVDSYLLIAAQTLGHDLWGRRLSIGRANARPIASRVALPIAGALAIGLASWRGSAIALFHDIGSIATAVLLLPMLGSLLWPGRFNRSRVLFSMLLCGGVTTGWVLSGSYGAGYPFGIHPIYVGIALSALVLLPLGRHVTGSK